MSEENQAIEAPQSVEDKLGEALEKLVEADTKAEHAWHEEQMYFIAAEEEALRAKTQAEYTRHSAAIASLRECVVEKLLAAAQSIPASAPVDPKATRNIRSKKAREADAKAIVAKFSHTGGLWSVSAMANATLLDVAIVRSTLNSLVKEGRVIKKGGKGRGVTYSLPPAAPASAGGA